MTSTTNHFDGGAWGWGSEQDCSVARYAATEAERLGARLDILHVLPGEPERPPHGDADDPPKLRSSLVVRQILANAKEAALDAVGGQRAGGEPRTQDPGKSWRSLHIPN